MTKFSFFYNFNGLDLHVGGTMEDDDCFEITGVELLDGTDFSIENVYMQRNGGYVSLENILCDAAYQKYPRLCV